MHPPDEKYASERQQIIVLVDGADNYYEVPRATLEAGRVDADRRQEVADAIEDVPGQFAYIALPTIPGSTAIAHFEGVRQLHYAGFYLTGEESTE
jgi:hypothetical protein